MQKDSKTSETVVPVLLANHRRFLSFLESRVGSRHDAEEILQNAFVRSIEKADGIRDSGNAIAWFYRLLRNAVIDHHRHNAASQRSLEAFAVQSPNASEPADPDMERLICECVGDLVNLLKPDQAELINRVDIQGKPVATVAGTLGISAGNARVRLYRARAALRKEVEQSCRTCATHGCLDCTCAGKNSAGDTVG
jgi:RNA polymerase sigma factor (sigma-70 family)